MSLNLAQKLISDHLVEGDLTPGRQIAISIDQTLTQDATGTLVMLVLQAGATVTLKALHGRDLDEDSVSVGVGNGDGEISIPVRHDLSPRQIAVLRAGGLINHYRMRRADAA